MRRAYLNKTLVVVWAPLLAACASAGRLQRVDLTPAREALEDARKAGAAEKARESFTQAEEHLKQAEALAEKKTGKPEENAHEATWLARLATAEARGAASSARLLDGQAQVRERTAVRETQQEIDRLLSRNKKYEEEQHRLEERIVFLLRDLDLTETEVIRTKARLKGLETKAEASSAIAEARILVRRLIDEGRTATLARCQEQLARAERLLQEENFGAALFFAMKAQDAATEGRRGIPTEPSEPDRPSPQKTYVVRAVLANIRKEPNLQSAVLATAARGAALEGVAVRGDWVKVVFQGNTGWIARSLVE